jgi:hypothetical protein
MPRFDAFRSCCVYTGVYVARKSMVGLAPASEEVVFGGRPRLVRGRLVWGGKGGVEEVSQTGFRLG